MQETILAAQDLYCERDERVLFSGLSFVLATGGALRVEGVNGSGKTTLLRILAGLNQAWEGVVTWRGEPLSARREEMAGEVLFIGHATGIKAALTAEENLAWLAGLRGAASRGAIRGALAQVGLAGSEDLESAALSAGQQRRVALARLFLSPARLWILDEPFTSLDRDGIGFLEGAMKSHLRDGGALVFSSHQDPVGLGQYASVSLQRDAAAEARRDERDDERNG